MDPVAGLVGAVVIASWSHGLVRDAGAILLEMAPDTRLETRVRALVAAGEGAVSDLHVWRLGPGHLGAIVGIVTSRQDRDADYFRRQLASLPSISHLTIEVTKAGL